MCVVHFFISSTSSLILFECILNNSPVLRTEHDAEQINCGHVPYAPPCARRNATEVSAHAFRDPLFIHPPNLLKQIRRILSQRHLTYTI